MSVKYLCIGIGPMHIPPTAGTTRRFELISRLAKRAEVHGLFLHSKEDPDWSTMVNHPKFKRVFSSISYMRCPDRILCSSRLLNVLTHRPLFSAVAAKITEAVAAFAPVKLCTLSQGAFWCVPRRYWMGCLVDLVDARSMLSQQRLRVDKCMPIGARLRLHLSLPFVRHCEKFTYTHAAVVTLNSSRDIDYVKKWCPAARVRHVPDGCDFSYFSEKIGTAPTADNELLIIGHMRYPPNADAARVLLSTIMPMIWQRRPDVKVTVVGPEPPREVQALHDGSRVNVTGFVDDVRPYLHRATIVVSPLAWGAGMKNKLQTALAAGKAMVASSVTCEGFDRLTPGTHVLVADDPQAFADAVCRLLHDPEQRQRIGEEGQKLIRDHYSWDAAADRLMAAFDECQFLGAS